MERRDGRIRRVWSSRSSRGVLLGVVGCSALLLHVLACRESPMAFSPDGTKLGFLISQPFDVGERVLEGSVHRLMVLTDGKELKTIETGTQWLLSAPAFRPDGKRMVYVRLPLVSEEQVEGWKESAKAKGQEYASLGREIAGKWERPVTGAGKATALSEGESVAVLSRAQMAAVVLADMLAVEWPGVLVERDVETGEVVRQVALDVPVRAGVSVEPDGSVDVQDDPYSGGLMLAVGLLRPVYGPAGEVVYVATGPEVVAVNLAAGERRVVARVEGEDSWPAGMSVSPDGKVVALQGEGWLELVEVDGARVTRVRLPEEAQERFTLEGVVWLNNYEVLVYAPSETEGVDHVFIYDRYGHLNQQDELPFTAGVDTQEGFPAIAVSPVRQGGVIAGQEQVLFVGEGLELLGQVKVEKGEMLTSPVYSPDGSRVAMKWLREDPEGAAIVIYSHEGKELSRVEIEMVVPKEDESAGEEDG